ncbi:PREDICTED: uncharacterized protein LOC100634107 [Amphimedon queenslandica]|uniref:Lysine-specific metallo-endopeptidase domain-containing protein n=1 Tax=Amphimedon queenslandica TaxID=400682 RepID=A0A1X7UNE7_AMPQE|nr:PREDICTED: uncharacterized protein LOC100634107 [Amphimedon queenslandica]|eukprot:XP_019853288.1 PREDICTED: uncharacterized protein LOC100634107 [Amphimedon queenslandica]
MKAFILVSLITCAFANWPISVDMNCDTAQSIILCGFEFTNNANKDLYLLKRNTPLEGLLSEFIKVSPSLGHSLLYEGPLIYRLPPTKDEFVLLKAGKSISTSVPITDAFSFKIDGIYTVRYIGPIQYLSVEEMEIFEEQIRESQIRDAQIRIKQIRNEQIRGEQIRGEQIRDEQIRDEQIRGEQIRDEQIRGEQIRGEQIRGEQIRDEQIRDEQIRDEQIRDEQIRGEQIRGEQIRDEQIRDEQIRGEQIRGEQIRDEQIRGEQIRDEQIRNEKIRGEQIRDEQIGDEQIRELQIRMEQIRESNAHKLIEMNIDDAFNLLKPEHQEQVNSESEMAHFESCSTTTISGAPNQNDETLKAHQKLCDQIAKASGTVGNNDLYTTWFGAYSDSRSTIVKDVYQKCADGLRDNATIYYNHGIFCKPNTIAYTFKNGVKVYLCPYYFKQPTFCDGNAYTKEATLIHEWAHAFGLTDDVTYGATNCMNLASTTPYKAIDNADNYRFHYCNAY